METFKERLEKIMEVKELNPNKLATLLGTSSVNIYRYMNGGAEQPSVGMLNKFEKIGISKNWLLDGKGEMFIAEENNVSKSSTPEWLLEIKQEYDKRLEELSMALQDARYTIKLQKKMLGENVNFLNLSKVPPVKRFRISSMRVYAQNTQIRA